MERGGLGRKELLARRYCFACAVVSRHVLPQQSGGERKLEERGKEMREEERSEGYGAVERRAWRCTNLLALFPGSRYDVRVRPKHSVRLRAAQRVRVCDVLFVCVYIYSVLYCTEASCFLQPTAFPRTATILVSPAGCFPPSLLHPSSLLPTTQ